eukprot:GILI01007095.1.p1 GENE.GILI01007095.1~~GILI01007095.1.p1  ORF type:complete len:293 (-),score=16.82 GILI01007095.1:62-940(-)
MAASSQAFSFLRLAIVLVVASSLCATLASSLGIADEDLAPRDPLTKIIKNHKIIAEIHVAAVDNTVRHDSPYAVFVTCALSHIMIAPSIKLFWRRKWLFEFCISVAGLLCSFMYHSCQAFNVEFILPELKWHVLDNVFVICNFANMFTYLAILRDGRTDFLIKASALFIAIVTQTRAPWEITHTIFPIFLFGMIPIVCLLTVHRTMNIYDFKNFATGTGLLGVAIPFFVLGLDDAHDPYRMFHGIWHVFAGTSAYYLWQSVKLPVATNLQTIMYGENGNALLNRIPRDKSEA